MYKDIFYLQPLNIVQDIKKIYACDMTRSGVPQEKIIHKLNMNDWENFDNKLEINSTVADKRGVSTNK